MSTIDLRGKDLLCTHWVVRGTRKLDGVSRALSQASTIQKIVVDSDDIKQLLNARCNCGTIEPYCGSQISEESTGTIYVLRALSDEHVTQLLNNIPTGCGCYILIEYTTKTMFENTLHFRDDELLGVRRRLEDTAC